LAEVFQNVLRKLLVVIMGPIRYLLIYLYKYCAVESEKQMIHGPCIFFTNSILARNVWVCTKEATRTVHLIRKVCKFVSY
jgi:hypothetical protein